MWVQVKAAVLDVEEQDAKQDAEEAKVQHATALLPLLPGCVRVYYSPLTPVEAVLQER